MKEDEILKAKCRNCESAYRQHGKLCPWRSISGDYCFDGMNKEEARREIKKNFDDFQTKIAGSGGKYDGFCLYITAGKYK